KAVHPRHFDVEHDNIDGFPRKIGKGVLRRCNRGANLELRPLIDDPFQNAAHDQAVIDEHHTHGARRGQGCRLAAGKVELWLAHFGPQATPTSCNFPSSVSRSNGFITYSSAPASIAARI